MDNKQNIKGIGGLLTVYLVFLYISIVGQIFSLFLIPITVSSSVITALSLFAIISIYKKSPHAALINKSSLIFQIIVSIYGLNQSFDPQLSSSITFGLGSTLVVDALFLLYWFISRRVKNTFIVEQVITNTEIGNLTNVSAQTTIDAPTSPDNHIEGRSVAGVIHRTNFTVVLLLLPGAFIFTGFGIFFYIPIALVFSIFFAAYFTHLFKKNHTSASHIYPILLSLVLGYVSLALNIGGVSDSSHPFFVLPEWLGIPTEGIESFFYTLFQVSLLYFVLLFFINIVAINKKTIKYSIYTCLLGIMLVGSHVGLVLMLYPEAKEAIEQRTLQEQKDITARLDTLLKFDFAKIRKDTFIDRKASIFTPLDYSKSQDDKCPYAVRLMDFSLDSKPFIPLSLSCLNEYFIAQRILPVSETGVHEYLWNPGVFVKKGDIVVFVADLPKGAYPRVYVDNNHVTDVVTGALPEDIQDNIDPKSAAEIQPPLDKRRTVMILYPINKDNVETLRILISREDYNDPASYTIREFAVFHTTN